MTTLLVTLQTVVSLTSIIEDTS